MEKAKNQLKASSFVILFFVALSLVNVALQIFSGKLNVTGMNDIAKIVAIVISVLVLLPQVYVGVKGLKMAKAPDSSKAHIVWAAILMAFGVIALIDPISALANAQNVSNNIASLATTILEICIYVIFISSANTLRKSC